MNKPMTKRDKVCLYIYENGPKTCGELVKAFPNTDHKFFSNMAAAGGPLDRIEKKYDLTPKKRQYFDQCEIHPTHKGELAAPADVCLYQKPWSGKFSFTNAPRREPIRTDMTFLNGGIGFNYGYLA